MSDIVVGIDGSPGSAAALRWGVHEGRVRRRPVTALLAWGYLDQLHAGRGREFDASYDASHAAKALAAAVEEAVGPEAAGALGHRVVNDLAPRALVEASRGADMVVVGARGRGGFAALLLGSVSDQVLNHAGCPVVIVREGVTVPTGDDGDDWVVVGIDGSAGAAAALRWAITEARARAARLEVVYAAGDGGDDEPSPSAPAEQTLEGQLSAGDTHGLDVVRTPRSAPAAQALLEAAADASVLVVGSRGRGGFAGLLLGSVSQQVARHAPCPVVVVRRPGDIAD